MHTAYIIAAKRSAVGKAPRGIFQHTRPDDLLIALIQDLMHSFPQLPFAEVDDVVIGNAFPEAEQGFNIARMSAQLAGLPQSVSGLTINRWCSSGLNAIQIAADRIRTGEAHFMLAGGVESMSRVPMMGNVISMNPRVFQDEHANLAYGMGMTAENVARDFAISREAQDAFALQSHQRALACQAKNGFAAQIVPYTVRDRLPDFISGGVRTVEKIAAIDEGPRADTSLEALAKLRSAFAAKGSVTAGNSSQLSDGAALVMLVSEAFLKRYQLEPLARYAGFSVKGVAPELMGIGPQEAIPAVCRQAGISLNDVQWTELNEAFAAQALAVMNKLELDPERTNPDGGAIALGHPLGATGAILTSKLIHGMRRESKSGYGLVSMCIGGGMGAAGLFEIF